MSRLRSEDGFTVMEVLTAMTVGLVLLGATLGLLESTVRLNTGVLGKTDAMQRGRLAMDTITQQLRSQVCFDVNTSAIVEGSDEYKVTFFSDFSAGGSAPVKRSIEINEAAGGIVARRYDPPSPLPSPFTTNSYPGNPTASNLVLENAYLQFDTETADPDDTVPFLRYYAYEEVGGVMRAEKVLTPPLDASEAARAARIEIAYVSLPTGANDGSKAIGLNDQVMARHSDPNLAVPDPTCV